MYNQNKLSAEQDNVSEMEEHFGASIITVNNRDKNNSYNGGTSNGVSDNSPVLSPSGITTAALTAQPMTSAAEPPALENLHQREASPLHRPAADLVEPAAQLKFRCGPMDSGEPEYEEGRGYSATAKTNIHFINAQWFDNSLHANYKKGKTSRHKIALSIKTKPDQESFKHFVAPIYSSVRFWKRHIDMGDPFYERIWRTLDEIILDAGTRDEQFEVYPSLGHCHFKKVGKNRDNHIAEHASVLFFKNFNQDAFVMLWLDDFHTYFELDERPAGANKCRALIAEGYYRAATPAVSNLKKSLSQLLAD
jgi:hypothetical protein